MTALPDFPREPTNAVKTRRPENVLSPRLEQVLVGIMDREFAEQLRAVYEAAAQAIDQLSALNLVRYEAKAAIEDGPADLSLWEEMAPAVRDTMIAVNSLLQVIRQQFPAQGTPSNLEHEAPASMDARLAQEVESVLHGTAQQLGQELASVRERVLKPEVVSDRWALLTELQTVRRDFRLQIGNLVYLTAAAFGRVDRAEVVPGHQAEVDAAAQLRSTSAELRRSLNGRLQKLESGSIAPASIAQQVAEDLGIFSRMPAFLTLRTPQKRQLARLRADFTKNATETTLTPQVLRAQITPLVELLQGFADTATQEVLTTHDRGVWLDCGLALQQARLHRALGSQGGRRVLGLAVKAASGLFGLDTTFDVYLRKLRNTRFVALTQEQLDQEIDTFEQQLSKLPFR